MLVDAPEKAPIPAGTKRIRIVSPIPDKGFEAVTVGQVYRMPNPEANALMGRNYAAKVYRREAPVRAMAPAVADIKKAIEPAKDDG